MSAFSRIEVEVGLDGRGFRSGLNQMSSAMGRWTSQIKGQLSALFGIGFMTRMIRETVLWGSKMQDLALQVGLTTDELQLFDLAGKKTGTTVEQLTTAIGVLGKNRNDVLRNISQKADAFDKIFGITGSKEARKGARDALIKDKSLGELFLAIGEQFNTKDFGGATSGLLSEMIGKNGPRFLVAFKEGFGKIFNDLKNTKGAITQDITIKKLDELADKWSVLIAQMRGPFADVLIFMVEMLEKGFAKVEESVAFIANVIQVINERGGISLFAKEGVGGAVKDAMDTMKLSLATAARSNLDNPDRLMRESKSPESIQREKDFYDREISAILDRMEGRAKSGINVENIMAEATNRTAEDVAERDQKRMELEIANEKINRLTRQDDVDEAARKSGVTKSIPTDALSKIGGFVGRSDRVLTVQERIARASEAQVDLLKKGIKIHDL